jgi:hypothetical protein
VRPCSKFGYAPFDAEELRQLDEVLEAYNISRTGAEIRAELDRAGFMVVRTPIGEVLASHIQWQADKLAKVIG